MKCAGIGADVLRVDVCSLVTQAEIARRIGRSRQLVHQYMSGIRGPGTFPAPACNITVGASLWSWCEVAHWLRQNDMISHDAATEAQEVALINAALEMRYHRQLDPKLSAEILRSLSDEPSSLSAPNASDPAVGRFKVQGFEHLVGQSPALKDNLEQGESFDGMDLERDRSPGRDVAL